MVEHEREWNFFQGEPVATTETYPCDLNTTSIALTVTGRPKEVISSVMDEMLNYIDKDGIVQVSRPFNSNSSNPGAQQPQFHPFRQTYFDHGRLSFDPIVCVNVLTLFHVHGRGDQLPKTFAWVREVLINRGYVDGTCYYATPECFLFFMARLLEQTKDTDADILLRPIFWERVQERTGGEGDALALAMRVLACASVGIRNEADLHTLLSLQQEDGSWEAGWIYRYGYYGVGIGNRGLTTALAINAVEALSRLPQAPLYEPKPSVPESYQISIASRNSPVVGDHLQSRTENAHHNGGGNSPAGKWANLIRKRLRWPWSIL